jgi:type I restriction enzyme S subunit
VTVRDIVGRTVAIDTAARISPDDFARLERDGCRPRIGDVLFSKDGSVGKVAVVQRDDFVVLSSLAILSPARRVDSSFLAYCIESAPGAAQIESLYAGAALKRITLDEIIDIEVPVPPLPQQRAIAAFLDRETRRIDVLIAQKERLLELLAEKRTALITRAVTKGLDPAVPMKESGVAWLGEVPAHWEVKRLWHLTPSDRPIMYGIVLPGPNVDDGVPIVKGGDVTTERLRLDRLSRTTYVIESGYARSRLRGGDIVFAIRGSIGEVATIPHELEGANLTQDAARVACTSTTHGPWLLYALKSKAVFAQLEAGAVGATIRGVNIRDLKRASIPLPPRPEQEGIATFLDQETAKIDSLMARIRDGVGLLREYRTALISAAVTGQVDVSDR